MAAKRVKRALTLLEMMLCICLLAIALGACCFGLAKALQKERFEQAVEHVAAFLTLAQELMLDLRMDVDVHLVRQEQGVLCTIVTQRKLPKRLENVINLRKCVKGIDQICFDQVASEKISLHYCCALGTTPEGELMLRRKSQSKILVFNGYPSHIQRVDPSYKQNIDEFKKQITAPYPEEALSFI